MVIDTDLFSFPENVLLLDISKMCVKVMFLLKCYSLKKIMYNLTHIFKRIKYNVLKKECTLRTHKF